VIARLIAFSLVILLCGCTSEEDERVRAAQAYLQARNDVADNIRLAILEGKVVLGMFPDEAHHAGGSLGYELLGAPPGTFPPDAIFSQRQRPDPNVTIRLFFRNRTQYGGDEAVPFSVTFQKGKAVAIKTAEEEDNSDAEEVEEAEFEAAYRQSALKALAESGRVPQEGTPAAQAQRIQALAAILRGDGRGGPPEQGLVLEGAAIALGQIGRPALPTLIPLLMERHYWTRTGACIALGVAGAEAETAIPHLRELLKSEEAADVSNASKALGAMGSAARAVVPDLILLLKRPEIYVRNGAAMALGDIGPEAQSAVPALTQALEDQEEDDRRYWKTALRKIGRPSVGAR
jgi:HEAT repeat protein